MMSIEPEISLADQAYKRLQSEILTCVLTPGQIVSERELAGQYKFSKTPIREALARTCFDGLTQRLPGRGYMVAPITVKDIRDLFDLRMILETAAAERAAQQPSSELIACLRQMSEVKYEPDEPETHISFLKTNRDFHLALASAAANRRLVVMMDDLFNEMERLFHLGLRLRDSSEEMRVEHSEVVAALELGNVTQVRAVLAEQIIASRDRILEAILHGEIEAIRLS